MTEPDDLYLYLCGEADEETERRVRAQLKDPNSSVSKELRNSTYKRLMNQDQPVKPTPAGVNGKRTYARYVALSACVLLCLGALVLWKLNDYNQKIAKQDEQIKDLTNQISELTNQGTNGLSRPYATEAEEILERFSPVRRFQVTALSHFAIPRKRTAQYSGRGLGPEDLVQASESTLNSNCSSTTRRRSQRPFASSNQ